MYDAGSSVVRADLEWKVPGLIPYSATSFFPACMSYTDSVHYVAIQTLNAVIDPFSKI